MFLAMTPASNTRPQPEREELSLAGKSHVADLSWENSARMVEKAIQDRIMYGSSEQLR